MEIHSEVMQVFVIDHSYCHAPFFQFTWTVDQLYVNSFKRYTLFCYRPPPLPRLLLPNWDEHTHTHTHTHTHLCHISASLGENFVVPMFVMTWGSFILLLFYSKLMSWKSLNTVASFICGFCFHCFLLYFPLSFDLRGLVIFTSVVLRPHCAVSSCLTIDMNLTHTSLKLTHYVTPPKFDSL